MIWSYFSFLRQPFEGVEQYDSLKSNLVELSIRLATIAQRDMFAENQATVILQSCLKLANISDKIIQVSCLLLYTLYVTSSTFYSVILTVYQIITIYHTFPFHTKK